ncbi:MAG: hypothetical protein JWQ74_2288 [Marmoricola sp.]|nr:hypothetical protein [Marmoricola sp.]
MTQTFTDLQPTTTDAARVLGGSFAGFGPVVIPLPGGAALTLFGNVD